MPMNGFPTSHDNKDGISLGSKSKLVNNLVALNQSASMSDSILSLINKVANLGYVGSKRYATGTATWSGTSGSTLTISGLTFAPTSLLMWDATGSYPGFISKAIDGSWHGCIYFQSTNAYLLSGSNTSNSITATINGTLSSTVKYIVIE